MKKVLIYLTLILVLGTALFLTVLRYTSYSEGYRAGVMMKISKKGVFFKTLEGQMNMGAMHAGNEGDLSTVWDFSIHKGEEQVMKDLEKAIDGGYRVKLYYEEKFMQIDFWGDTHYFVTKVERVGESEVGTTSDPMPKAP